MCVLYDTIRTCTRIRTHTCNVSVMYHITLSYLTHTRVHTHTCAMHHITPSYLTPTHPRTHTRVKLHDMP